MKKIEHVYLAIYDERRIGDLPKTRTGKNRRMNCKLDKVSFCIESDGSFNSGDQIIQT